jgi:hypothetical protein
MYIYLCLWLRAEKGWKGIKYIFSVRFYIEMKPCLPIMGPFAVIMGLGSISITEQTSFNL